MIELNPDIIKKNNETIARAENETLAEIFRLFLSKSVEKVDFSKWGFRLSPWQIHEMIVGNFCVRQYDVNWRNDFSAGQSNMRCKRYLYITPLGQEIFIVYCSIATGVAWAEWYREPAPVIKCETWNENKYDCPFRNFAMKNMKSSLSFCCYGCWKQGKTVRQVIENEVMK